MPNPSIRYTDILLGKKYWNIDLHLKIEKDFQKIGLADFIQWGNNASRLSLDYLIDKH